MIKRCFFISVLAVVILIQGIFAVCEEGQVDINSASAEELMGIKYIGEVKAENIINARPFNYLDDLIRVNGIGNFTLEKIKEEGLACVAEEESEETPPTEEVNNTPAEIIPNVTTTPEERTPEKKEEKKSGKEKVVEESIIEPLINKKVEPQARTLEVINLNPQTIKSQENNEKQEKQYRSKYAMYGFVSFSILLGILFLLKKNKYNQNEFIK